jgi:hypothetical protein
VKVIKLMNNRRRVRSPNLKLKVLGRIFKGIGMITEREDRVKYSSIILRIIFC